MEIIHSFPPIVNKKSKVLILGSMPGLESLRKQQYYGLGRNHFWKLIYGIFKKIPETDYNNKISFLLRNNIALWDVIKCCEREGSLDSNIRRPEINNFKWLFNNYSNIRHIFFNGTTAEKLFKKNVQKLSNNIPESIYRLPSSSPANTMPYKNKLTEWNVIREKIEKTG